MPALTYSNPDFVAFTKIKSAEVNAKFNDIQTLLNTTGLDDSNIQDDGITRATKLKAGTSNAVVVNDSSGDMTDIAISNGGLLTQINGALAEVVLPDGGLISKGSGDAQAVAAGVQGQILQSNGSNVPTWIDSPFVLPTHYIASAATNADGQEDFIRPAGGGADDFNILCSTTNLVVVIENTQSTLTQDISVTGLDPVSTTTANITATINDPLLADEQWTKTLGELDSPILLDSVGSEIVSKAGGGLAAFRLTTGAGTELFIGRISSDTVAGSGKITDARRGYFVDDAGAAINRIVCADNDTLTLLNLYWVFVDSANAAHTTTLEPIYSGFEPAAPSSGQYWFDYTSNQWKVFDGATFNVQPRALVGLVCVDENDAVVGARSFNVLTQASELNTITFSEKTASTIKSGLSGEINVLGVNFRFLNSRLTWDIADNDQRVPTEAADTWYWMYITKTGELKIDDVAPYNREDLKGRYHPHKPWRSVGQAYNNASQNFTTFFDTRPNQALEEYIINITATLSDPTKGSVSAGDDRCNPSLVGRKLSFQYRFSQGSGGSAGSGNYLFALPDGLTIDTFHIGTNVPVGSFWTGSNNAVGICFITDTVPKFFRLAASTSVANIAVVGSASNALSAARSYYAEGKNIPLREISTKDLR